MQKTITCKLLSMLLAFGIIINIIIIPQVSAAEYTSSYYTYTIENNEAKIIDVNESISGSITIPSTLGSYPVTKIKNFAFYNCDNVYSFVIPNSVVELGFGAFGKCDKLESITIGSGVSYIDRNPVLDCIRLQNIYVNSQNKYYTSLNGVLFSHDMTKLIAYPTGRSGNYTIPEGTTEITECAFLYCNNLTGINIPKTVNSISNDAFNLSQSINYFYVDKDSKFYSSYNNTLMNKDITEVIQYPTNKSGAFIIPNGVKTITPRAFAGCNKITNVVIPNTVTSIGERVFEDCDNITIKIPNSIDTLSNEVFFSTTNTLIMSPYITSLDIPSGTTVYGVAGSYVESYIIKRNESWQNTGNRITFVETTQIATPQILYYTEEGKTFISLSCSDKNAEIYYTTDGSLPYAGSTKYTEPFAITENITIKAIAEQDYHVDSEIAEMVYDFDNLRYLTFDSETGTVTACSADARNVTIPEYINGVKVVAIGDRAFENCANLYSVNIPQTVTSIGQECFKGCESLQNITVPDSVTTIGTGVFTGCLSLSSATLSSSLTFIPNRTFKNCQSLNNVVISPSIQSIGIEAFADCKALSSLTIPRSVYSIGNYAFSGCSSLRNVNIPTGVSSIGVNTFNNCTALVKATIPAEVSAIASGAFGGCVKLTIYGYKNSQAQTYAKENNIPFVLIPDAVSSINETFEKDELPAGWNCTDGTAAYWSVGSTQEGDYHAMFNSYNSASGSKGRLVSPSVKVAEGQTVFVSCYMYHDLSYSTRKDKLHLEYSVDNGDTWIPLTDDKIRYNGTEGWEKISAEIPDLENGTVCIGLVGTSDYGNYIYVDNICVSPVDNTAEVESVSFDVSDITINIGEEKTIKSSVLPENARNRSLAWTSSDESVVTVADGHIKAIKDGSAIITATSSNGKNARCNVMVTKAKTLPEVETKDASNITTNSANIRGAVTSDGNSGITSRQFVYYEKNSPNSKYTINADDNFNASLTNLKPSTEYWYQAQAMNEVGMAYGEVKNFTTDAEEIITEPDSIQINPTYLSLAPNDTRILSVTVLPANANNRSVVWESEDKSVVTVDDDGNIKAIGKGKTKVKATTVVNRLSAYCEIEVKGKELSGTFDFSEHNMITNSSNLNNECGFDWGPDDGGNSSMATAYLSRWNGAVLEKNDKYPSPAYPENIEYREVAADYHVQEVLFLQSRKNARDNDDIKKAIMDYGAVYSSFLVNWDCFDSSDKNYYLPENSFSNGGHAIAIVGWDDNYSKNNFTITPPGDGAFICKNSWGTRSGEDGFFYISYYDAQIGKRGINTVFNNVESNSNYNKIYQYDSFGAIGGYREGSKTYGANVFPDESTKLTSDEKLQAVSFYTNDKGVAYEVYVVTDYKSQNSLKKLGSPVATGVMEYAGYHTVNLENSINIKAGTRFAIVVKLSHKNGAVMSLECPLEGYSTKARANRGESFISGDGTYWTDTTDIQANTNVCIKAFTSTQQNRSSLISAIDNSNRAYESDTVITPEEAAEAGIVINPDLVEYLNTAQLSSDDKSEYSMGQIPDSIVIGDTAINFTEGTEFPSKYDLRDSNAVSSVKNQGGIGSCWSFATYASLESCLLKKADITNSGIISLDNVINNTASSSPVDSIKIADNCKIAVGTDKVIQAEILPLNAAKGLKWSSSDENVVTVDTSGRIYAKSIGSAVITAECGGKSARCNITVTNGSNVESIKINEKPNKLSVGEKVILDYSIEPEDASDKQVIWRSSNPNIASVDEYGVVTVLQDGEVTITAITADGGKTDVYVLNSDVDPSPSPTSPFTVINNGASAEVINNGAEQTVTVIIAGYEGDMLRSISTEDITFSKNEKRTFTLGSGTYKVFVWNSLSGMVPMAE